MIYWKRKTVQKGSTVLLIEGFYLFGFIPLYVRVERAG